MREGTAIKPSGQPRLESYENRNSDGLRDSSQSLENCRHSNLNQATMTFIGGGGVALTIHLI